jgi:hypothetical protein
MRQDDIWTTIVEKTRLQLALEGDRPAAFQEESPSGALSSAAPCGHEPTTPEPSIFVPPTLFGPARR